MFSSRYKLRQSCDCGQTSVYLIVQKYPEKVKRRRSNYHRMLRRSAQKSRSGLKPKTSAFLSLLSSFSLQLKYRAI